MDFFPRCSSFCLSYTWTFKSLHMYPYRFFGLQLFFKIGRRLCFHLTFYRNFRKQFELSWFYTPFSSKEFLIAKWSQNTYWHLMLNWISHKKNLPGFISNKACFENTKKNSTYMQMWQPKSTTFLGALNIFKIPINWFAFGIWISSK